MDRLIRATYARLRPRAGMPRRRIAWLPVAGVAAAILVGLTLGTALGRFRTGPAAPASDPAPTLSLATAPPGGSLPTTPTPMPTSAGTTVRSAEERDLWSNVRSSTSETVLIPTWLPTTVDRTKLDAVTARGSAGGTYRVIYGTFGPSVTFTMDRTAPARTGSSGIGLTVRGRPAVLSHPSEAHSQAGLAKLITWSEDGIHYGIASAALSGDDLVRIAWSLGSEPAPSRPSPSARTGAGQCSTAGATSQDVIRRLLDLSGSSDSSAVADCFALEYLGQYPATGSIWAALPRTADVRFGPAYPFGGREIVTVTWKFGRDPGGAWNPQPTRFFMVGIENDRPRVYEVWSAPASLPR